MCVWEKGGQTEIKDTHSFFQQTWSIPSELGVELDTGTQRWRESVNTFNKRHSSSANKGRERGIFRGGLESIAQHMNMWIFMRIALFPPSTQLPFGHLSQGGHGHSNNTSDWFISLQNTCWLLLSIVGSSKHQTRIPYTGKASIAINPSQGAWHLTRQHVCPRMTGNEGSSMNRLSPHVLPAWKVVSERDVPVGRWTISAGKSRKQGALEDWGQLWRRDSCWIQQTADHPAPGVGPTQRSRTCARAQRWKGVSRCQEKPRVRKSRVLAASENLSPKSAGTLT